MFDLLSTVALIVGLHYLVSFLVLYLVSFLVL